MSLLERYDPALYGGCEETCIVAVEIIHGESTDKAVVFRRESSVVSSGEEPFHPFIMAESTALSGCPVPFDGIVLSGPGPLNLRAVFKTWKDCLQAVKWLSSKTGYNPSSPDGPYQFINDPVQQHLMVTGKTLFKGMEFNEVSRMQLDIECLTSDGYEFCNPERDGDRIIAIALSGNDGWSEVISGDGVEEKEMLERMVDLIRERDPDVVEGHNIFNFDLRYIRERARINKVKLKLGRDGSVPKVRPSRFSVGERTVSYQRYDVFGRHVIDTMFLLQAYDISHRSLDGYGLKQAAVHFGIAPEGRTYIDGSEITSEFRKNPGRVMKYVLDDVVETRGLSGVLSPAVFTQAQVLPYSYQNAAVRGNATKIDALLVREYIRQGHSLPVPGPGREFEGGYTDIFISGVVRNVHHCDVRSLYPSLMLTGRLAPRNDRLGVFLGLLDILRTFRLDARQKMIKAEYAGERDYLDALQSTFKVLINSFYGYLGFPQARFCDFDMAARVTAAGRELLRSMIEWLRELGAQPVEIDTDGIYFVPPAAPADIEKFRDRFRQFLPEGIEIEFDGEYEAMYSYKMKNYALRTYDGEVIIKGAALKSRGLEPFQRDFLRELIAYRLEGRDNELVGLKDRYEKAIAGREWDVSMLAKTETLQDSPQTYRAKSAKGGKAKRAVYELALRSGREYRAGDQITYYVTGNRKSVAVHENCKFISEWDPSDRDDNIPYYIAKLAALSKKFIDEVD